MYMYVMGLRAVPWDRVLLVFVEIEAWQLAQIYSIRYLCCMGVDSLRMVYQISNLVDCGLFDYQDWLVQERPSSVGDN